MSLKKGVFSLIELRKEIEKLKRNLDVTVLAHYYQRDEVFYLADIVGDSLELSRKAINEAKDNIVFCGVGFMGQSVKILNPTKRVLMPKIACCAMAKMIDLDGFKKAISYIESFGLVKEELFPITYINSNADIKAEVAKLGGMICTSSNAKKVTQKALDSGKKIFFMPDRCLGINIANSLNLTSCVVGDGINPKTVDVICYDGFCSIHQLFSVEDVEFFREKYSDILIVVHPECSPDVVKMADFVGSTSQILNFVKTIPNSQKIAVGTEFNLVNRLRKENCFILSSTKPECPTMNETTIKDLYNSLKSIESGKYIGEIFVDNEVAKWANIALERMLEIQ